ncbi:MAG: tetratricopeptide repeat protein [Planctomycetia bacterium]|nr:tetratricopeptide repeat protein [Planctomycetia bacterium]
MADVPREGFSDSADSRDADFGDETREEALEVKGKTVCFYGQLAGMSRKKASGLVRRAGGRVASELHEGVNLIVLGEGRPLDNDWRELILQSHASARTAFERGAMEIVTESRLWKCFPVSELDDVTESGSSFVQDGGESTLYTPSMLAELVSMPVPVILHWYRSGLLQAVSRMAKLPYFDAFEFLVARQIKTLLSGELTVDQLAKRVSAFQKRFGADGRVIMKLSLAVDGKDVYYRQGDVLYDWRGQPRLGLDVQVQPSTIAVREQESGHERATEASAAAGQRIVGSVSENAFSLEGLFLEQEGEREFEFQMGRQVVRWCEEAWRSQKEGDLEKAIDCYRAALMAGGADSGISFQLAELLEQQDELEAAAERYYMVLELDEEYTDARIGLARVLAQLDRLDESTAAWEGVLADSPDNAEAYFELGKILYRQGRFEEATVQLRYFQSLEPDSIHNPEIDLLLRGQE